MGRYNSIRIKKPAYTRDTSIYRIEQIPKVFIPVGEQYTVNVRAEERVLLGQILGESVECDIPVISSVSGTVVGRVNINGKEYIEINNDGKYEPSPSVCPCNKRLSELSDEEILLRIRQSGIHDWIKISNAMGRTKRFALNCLDSDPYSWDKKCAVTNYTNQIIGGAKIVLKLLGLRLCEIVIERKNTDQINLLIDCIESSTLFDIIETNGKYPTGDAQRIIAHLPESEDLDENELFVLDVHSAAAIYRAFSQGMPYVSRTVSIGGSAVCRGGCYNLPLGTPINCVREELSRDNISADGIKAVIGGVMRGTLLKENNAILTDGTHTVSFIESSELTISSGDCIGCGKCDRVCPDGLLPSIAVSPSNKDLDNRIYDSGMDMCTDCGACEFVCPAGIPIRELARKSINTLPPEKKYKKQRKENAPFIQHTSSTRSINFDVILALCVLLSWSVFCFGTKALLIALISTVTAVLSDLLFRFLTKNAIAGVFELGSVSCGLLGALTLSPKVPLYVPIITAFFSVMILRGAFGAKSNNLFHSAFGARVLASLIFHDAFIYSDRSYTTFDFIIGNTEGALGEVSVVLLLAVMAYLLIRGVISLIIPSMSISTFAIVSFLTSPAANAAEFTQLALIGTAIIFVSVFCEVEYSTVPKSRVGKVAYGAILGGVAALIGSYTSYEGAYIAAIAASVVTPLLNSFYTADVNLPEDICEHLPDGKISEKEIPEELPPEKNDDIEETEKSYSEIVFDCINPISPALSNDITETTSTDEDFDSRLDADSFSNDDFSDTNEFSDSKADEILELLAKELGLTKDNEDE